MKGFVLAAGFGTRLNPITETTPKPLLPVGRLPLIAYSLRLLAHHGITEVVVNLHHRSKLVREALGDGSDYGVHITYSQEDEILGTGGGIKRMHEFLADDTLVVVNGDTVIDIDLMELIATHNERGALATMVLRRNPVPREIGSIEIDDAARIRRILGEGAPASDALSAFMFAGVHVIEPRFLEYIPPDVNTCLVRYAYTKALGNDEPLYAKVHSGCWADAGTPASYYAANADALARRMQLRHADPLAGYALEPKRDVADVVRMGEDVDLGTDARILPPVLLGDGTRVGDHACVGPEAVIGPRVTIGREAVVRRCVVLAGAKIEAGAELDGMIIGKKAMLAVEAGPRDEPSAASSGG